MILTVCPAFTKTKRKPGASIILLATLTETQTNSAPSEVFDHWASAPGLPPGQKLQRMLYGWVIKTGPVDAPSGRSRVKKYYRDRALNAGLDHLIRVTARGGTIIISMTSNYWSLKDGLIFDHPVSPVPKEDDIRHLREVLNPELGDPEWHRLNQGIHRNLDV